MKIPLTSVEFGSIQNLDSGATLKPVVPISGIDDEAFVVFEGIIGGQDPETATSLLLRTLSSRSNPVANFNTAAITKATRVWNTSSNGVREAGHDEIAVRGLVDGLGNIV